MGRGDVAKRNVLVMGATSFLADLSTEMCNSVLAGFVESVGGPLWRVYLGVIESLANLTAYAVRVLSGFIVMRVRRCKLLASLGYGISAVGKAVLALSTTVLHVVAAKFIDRFGKGLRTTPRDVLLARSVTPSKAGKYFAIHRVMDQLGAVIGPLIAFVAMTMFSLSERQIFALAVIPGVAAALTLFTLAVEVGGEYGARRVASLRGVFVGDFNRFIAVVAMFSLGSYSLVMLLGRVVESGLPKWVQPLVFTVACIVHVAVAYPYGELVDRFGKRLSTLALPMALFAATSAALALANNLAQFVFAAALYGAYEGCFEVGLRAVAAKHVHAPRDAVYTATYLSIAISTAIGYVTVAAIWHAAGRVAAFTYASIVSTASALLALALDRRVRLPKALLSHT